MNNQQFTHEFFYSKDRYKNFNHLHFEDNNFLSYYTIIGSIQKSPKDKKLYTLISFYNMSSTTTKHIAYLEGASPYSVVYVPFQYGNSYFSFDSLINEFLHQLKINGQYLTQYNYRTEFIKLYNNFLRFIDLFKIKVKKADLQAVKDLYNKALEIEEKRQIAKEKRKNLTLEELEQRQIALEKRKARLLEKFQKSGYLNQLKAIFSTNSILSSSKKAELKRIIDINKYAYVYPTKEGIKTSKSVEIPEKLVKIALELWKNNKLKIGFHVSCYEVREITDKYIQIGCHCIRQDNIQALYNYYFGA